MTWYYVDAGQQAGPVDDAQLEELSRNGKIQPGTLIWHEGMANWEPYSKVKATAAGATTPPVPGAVSGTGPATDAVCSECGKTFPTADMIQHHGRYICAGCKPIFFQRLREGAAPAPGGFVTEDQVMGREYEVDLGTAVTRAWEAFTANPGIIIAGLIVVWVLFMVGGGIGGVVALFLGPFAPAAGLLSAVYAEALVGGLLWLMLSLMRKKEGSIGDCFVGFSGRNYPQLLLFGLFHSFLMLLVGLPTNLILQRYITGSMFSPGKPPNFPPEAMGAIFLFSALSWIALVVLSTFFVFVPLLIMDKGYEAWPAIKLSCKMVMRRWWMSFLFVLVAYLLGGVGVCACGIGLLVSAPVYFGMKAAFFDQNFGDLRHQ